MTLKFTPWAKKSRTMLRFVKPGDYFCFVVPDRGYGFGMIISDVTLGHSAKIYKKILSTPDITEEDTHSEIAFYCILDSYLLFDKKRFGDWRIVAHSDEQITTDQYANAAHFCYGNTGNKRKVNLFGQEAKCTDDECRGLPAYMQDEDITVQRRILALAN